MSMSSNPAAEKPVEFPLLEDVIVLADAAMRAREPRRIVDALVKGLRNLLPSVGELPPGLLQPSPDGYLRRELYRSPRDGYQVLAMTWGPGQGSTVHDHADTWGVEAVLRGRLEVVDYRVRDRNRALARLRASGRHELEGGRVIGLLPPHDLHACRNPGARDTTVTLHIYGTPLEEVRRYVHVEGELYRPERVRLASA